MHIESIKVTNFRCIESATLSNCGQFNVLIGRNNAGKSTLLAAIDAMSHILRGGDVVALHAPIGSMLDFCRRNVSSPIEILAQFRLDSHERAKLIADISQEAVRVRNAVDDLPEDLYLNVHLCIQRDSTRLAAVRSITLCGEPGALQEWTLLRLTNQAVAEIAARRRDIQDMSRFEEELRDFLSRSDDDDLQRIRREASERRSNAYLQYSLGRRGREMSAAAADTITAALGKDQSLAQAKDEIRTRAERLSEVLANTRGMALTTPVETFSGQEVTIPTYVIHMLQRLSNLKVHYLTDRRDPIGPEEAKRLLNLKMKRGGGDALRSIQETVSSLLGVKIDAFQGDERAGQGVAELDVDDFLVQANGSGIREALRLILDVEFGQPDIVLVEEPEMHLHPGLESAMMRYLKRVSSVSQVFVTTHSTNFLDTADMNGVFLISKNEFTAVRKLSFADAEADLPQELGLRLSSLFLFDRLVFVEGASDESVLRELASKLGISISQANVGFVLMGGSRNFLYYSSAHTLDFLRRRGIDMWFIIDRDEKDSDEVKKLTDQLGARAHLHVLAFREVENYLASPLAVQKFIELKLRLGGNTGTAPDIEAVRQALFASADKLKEFTLQKRVARSLLRPIHPRVIAVGEETGEAFLERLNREIDSHTALLEQAKARANDVVERIGAEVNKVWDSSKMELAPGAELIDLTCQKFGVRFQKEQDGSRLASCMDAREIPRELQELIRNIIA